MKLASEQIMRAARQLALVAGLLAIALAPALLFLQTPLERIEIRSFTVVAIDLVLGIVLLVAARQTKESPLTAVVLALIGSIALLALGGTAGLIAGLFGLAAAILAAIPLVQDFVME